MAGNKGKKKTLDIVSAVLAHMAAIVCDTKVLSGCVFVGLFIFFETHNKKC